MQGKTANPVLTSPAMQHGPVSHWPNSPSQESPSGLLTFGMKENSGMRSLRCRDLTEGMRRCLSWAFAASLQRAWAHALPTKLFFKRGSSNPSASSLLRSILPIWCLALCSFATRFIREAATNMPRASFLPETASESEHRQEERQCREAWMKLDCFSLKYLSEPGEGGERG